MKKAKMNTKNLMVSFVAIMALILVATSVSAITINDVSVDGILAVDDGLLTGVTLSPDAGETITIKVFYTADGSYEELKDVTVKIELGDSEVESEEFVIRQGNSDRQVLNIKVPYDFDDDELFKEDELEITIEGKDEEKVKHKDSIPVPLEIQRPSYNVDFKSVNVDSKVEAGETMSVDLLVKNTGYNDLDDLEVTVRIPTLGIEKTQYFGDLVSVESDDADVECEWTSSGWECDYDNDHDDNTDTMNKRMYLKVPYGAEAGTYALEVEVSNEDAIISKTVQFVVTNGLPETVIKSGNDLIVVNPTNKVAVYRVVYNEREVVESVNAGQSIRVPIEVPEGEYNFDVNVFTMTGEVVGAVNFSGESAEASTVANLESPVVILTVVLAIIFLVLLVVLIVLVTKKPEKTEEFGESYY